MRMNFRLTLSLTLALALAAIAAEGPTPTTLDVWPTSPAPGDTAPIGEEQLKKRPGTEIVTNITNVSRPTITLSRPSPEKNTGVAVLVFPGGGYTNLAWEHEGTMVAEWLNSIGVTAAVVKYRVPRRADAPKGQPPVAGPDGRPAGHQPGPIARRTSGGSTPRKSASSASRPGDTWPPGAPPTPTSGLMRRSMPPSRSSCRPDFAVLIYPGGITRRGSATSLRNRDQSHQGCPADVPGRRHGRHRARPSAARCTIWP